MAEEGIGVVCEECDGRGKVLDAPLDALDGRAYWDPCPVCGGTGLKPNDENAKENADRPSRGTDPGGRQPPV